MVNFKDIRFPSRLFITGIDTDAGKSYATGWLARSMRDASLNVITQKFVQTGNIDFSEDIEIHRRLMEIDFTEEDKNHLTAPEIFTYPASPDLAARIDKRELDLEKIQNATEILSKKYSYVLIEGAGGVMVPLKGSYLTIDYLKDHNLPVILVTNGRLGSINHTLLSLFALKQYGIEIFAVIYNSNFDKDNIICDDCREYIKSWLSANSPSTLFFSMPSL